jgi:chorismate mutase
MPADMNLDLERTVRPGLDILSSEILIALKKRSRFPQNEEIYLPGLVRGEEGHSLLQYELRRTEELHAELGRYTYANQESFTEVTRAPLIILREAPPSPVIPFRSGFGDRVKAEYQGWIRRDLAPGSDSNTWGETVTADVAALMSIFERITMGKYVAECKFRENEARVRDTHGEEAALREMIVHPEREAAVIDRAKALADRYEFPSDQAEWFFRWMIDLTVELQISYLRARISD